MMNVEKMMRRKVDWRERGEKKTRRWRIGHGLAAKGKLARKSEKKRKVATADERDKRIRDKKQSTENDIRLNKFRK